MNQKMLKESFRYENGTLIWKIKPSSQVYIGDIAGYKKPHGYIHIGFKGKSYLAHRLIWIYHNGDIPNGYEIDHIDRIRDNNIIENLRLLTNKENHWNRNDKGYYWNKEKEKFQVTISINNKSHYVGRYNTEIEAKNAYLEAKTKHHNIGDTLCG